LYFAFIFSLLYSRSFGEAVEIRRRFILDQRESRAYLRRGRRKRGGGRRASRRGARQGVSPKANDRPKPRGGAQRRKAAPGAGIEIQISGRNFAGEKLKQEG